jgi:melibiose permease/lactose/raffinose/galactose permease
MLPSLSIDQKVREKIGATARICASIGLFAVVVGVIPATKALGALTGSLQRGYFTFAVIICIIMILGQCITLFGVKEQKFVFKQEEKTTLRDMFRAIIRNDQLLYTALSMALFMIGYCTTTSFGVYFFKYAYKDEGMYSVFAMVLGVSQITALLVFPLFRKRFQRNHLYAGATIFVVAGYLIFFFSPMNMLFIGAAGVLIFVGQAFIQLLMLVFLMDTIEYGQWKLGRRNESVTFAVQPFIYKIGGAVGNGIVSVTVIIAGINAAKTPADVTSNGLLIMKSAMLFLPLILIVAGYLVYRAKFKIDKAMFDKIVTELKERGDILDHEA